MRDTLNPELLSRYLANKATPEEIDHVESWMLHNEIDRSTLQKLATPPEGVRVMLAVDADADWKKVNAQLQQHSQRGRLWLKIAASLVLVGLVGVAAYKTVFTSAPVAYTTAINTTQHEKQIVLADGSTVYLNGGASVRYAENFAEARNLELQGEAFFDVKRDEQHPFTIQAQQCEVKVLGTSFLVDADSALVEVVVKTGKVSFRSPDNQMVQLVKNETGVFDPGTNQLTERTSNDSNRLSWQSHVLVFENAPIDRVVHDLEKHFGVSITLRGVGKVVPLYTSTFTNPTLTEVLDEMKLILPMEYASSGKAITINIK
ncbi:FecR family protein [Chryseolinea lacunae]|uniref:FecR domain-containing protein n=1 Tax=Chryseolinea lacunae TaxID=2801331 RepID=A0ABS1KM99_9BACT|nr:FecR family protein [Chryseolinea lacunae]MBL0740566.1 FecR domain-containing protein [Chryseolinea lacunae]